MDFATVAASPTVEFACCESAVLLVSKNTIHSLVGPGGAGGGVCKDMLLTFSPHAATTKAIATIADIDLSIQFSPLDCDEVAANRRLLLRCGKPRVFARYL